MPELLRSSFQRRRRCYEIEQGICVHQITSGGDHFEKVSKQLFPSFLVRERERESMGKADRVVCV